MPYLITLVAVLTAATLLNLLLIVGVIRRLRDQDDRISALPQADGFPAGFSPPDRAMLQAGDRVPSFTATSTDGDEITRDGDNDGRRLVAFLSPECPGCLDQLPHLADYAAEFPGGRDQVLTVLAGTPEDVEPMRTQLEPHSRIVIEPWGNGAVAKAFDMKMWPAFALVEPDGTIAVVQGRVRKLPKNESVAA